MIVASRGYVERHGRPASPAEIGNHPVIRLDGELANIRPARWLQAIAPNAKTAARSPSVTGMLVTLKSGAGLAALPVHIGDSEADLVRVLDPVPELMSQIHLLAHPDLLRTPRVRAFFDFVGTAIDPLRPMLVGRADDGAR